jgi:hypothetical protein
MNANTEQEQLSIDGVPVAEQEQNETPHMVARINAMAIKAAYPFMAQNDIRYYLNAVNIRPLEDGTVMVVATDGHRFVVVHDQHGFVEKEIIVAVKKDALKSASTKTTFDVMSNGTVFLHDAGGIPQFIQPGNSLVEADFPRIENVVSPRGYVEGISGAVNPDYLKDALEIGQYFGSIRFFTKDADSALMFVVGGLGDLDVFGGIMKMRDSFEQLPAWFPKPSPFDLTKSPADPG